MRDPHNGLRSTRRSLAYIPDDDPDPKLRKYIEKHRTRWTGSLGYMFSEDIGHLLPFGHGLDDGFTARLVPENQDVHDLVLSSLRTFNGTPRTLVDGARSCLEDLGKHLISGSTIFEVEYLYTNSEAVQGDCQPPTGNTDIQDQQPESETGELPVAFRIGWIAPGTVCKRLRRYIQYVPAEFADGHTIRGLHYRELDRNNLVSIDLGWRHKAALRRSHAVMEADDKYDATPYMMLKASISEFDIDRFKVERAQSVLRGTRDIGWSARTLFDEHMLDPYMIWRRLQFQRLKISIRDAALAALNRMLTQAGERMGFEAQLQIEGLISQADVDDAEAALKDGSRPLLDLISLGT